MGCMDPFFCGRLTTVGGLVGLAGPQSGCQALSCVKAAGWWGRVMRQLAAVPWGGVPGPRASAGSLVGGVKVQVTLGLVPTHWWVKPGPGASVSSLAGRAGSWGLAAGLRGLRAGVRPLMGVGPVPDTSGCRVQGFSTLVLAC